MRFLLGGFGSRGDVQPMLALALALRSRSHSVTFVSTPDFQAWAQGLGLAFVAAGESMQGLLERTEKKPRELPRAVADSLRAHFRAMEPLAAEHDVIAASSATVAGASLAEKLGKRYHAVWFTPLVLPSSYYQPMHWVSDERFHSSTLPRWLNRLSWWAWQAGWNTVMLGEVVREERARLGLPRVANPYRHMVSQRLLLACEPLLAPLPPDIAPAEVTQTGAWFLLETGELSARVEEFLVTGPPPVYVGFGSMTDASAGQTTGMVLEAARLAGVRLLLAEGWARLGQRDLPPTAMSVGQEPHGRLFPRCAAVVHHGGAGTTTTAARAGVPQVVVPHLGDQFYWAQQTRRLGLSPCSIPKRRLRADLLASALQACLERPELRRGAAEFAGLIRADGLEIAVGILEGKGKAVPLAAATR